LDIKMTFERQQATVPQEEPMLIGRHIDKDGGFTSVGVVIALMLALALIFTSVQVHWMNSTSADIQFVADAGALAAENVVAEYMTIARLADAIILSLSLFGLAVTGIAIIISCIPYVQAAGKAMLEFGQSVFRARDSFANASANALDTLQKALPFLCAVNAASVISQNRISASGKERYIGLAVPLPLAGEEIKIENEHLEQLSEEIEQDNERTAAESEKAKEARDRMQASKLKGYNADCGDYPGGCQYERVKSLDKQSAKTGSNPYFSSVEQWQFDYAYARAKAYYAARLAAEKPKGSKLEEQVRSFARKRYFSFAVDQMGKGHAVTAPDGTLSAYFPLLPRNNDETRKTSLYTEKVYPVDAEGGIHGCDSCPSLTALGMKTSGSAQQSEQGVYSSCKECKFSINTIGSVGSATASIDTGFEYYYRIVAQAADEYKNAAEDYKGAASKAKESAEASLGKYSEALMSLKTGRLNPSPPGKTGCIAIAIDFSAHPVPSQISSSLIASVGQLQPRLAISAAALADDEADAGNSLIASFLDKVSEDVRGNDMADAAFGVFKGVLCVWGDALLSYGDGIEAMIGGLRGFIDSIPIVSQTPLASWAENAVRELLESMGLEAATLATPKPVLVNSYHVAVKADALGASAIVAAKRTYASLPGSGSSTLGDFAVNGLLDELENRSASLLDSRITLFELSFGDGFGLPRIPVTVLLPEDVAGQGKRAVADIRGSLEALVPTGGGGSAVWE
jgi:hypothetical protein